MEKKKKASNTGFGKSGRKATLKNAAKVLKPDEEAVTAPKVKKKGKKPVPDVKSATELMKGKLSPQEEFFCELYTSDVEFYGNGTQSYIEAFDVVIVRGKSRNETEDNEMTYDAVRKAASDLLTKTHILNRINELLEDGGFNDQFADKTLKFLMTQRADLRVSLGAIAEYNKLQSRITDRQTIQHQFANEDMTDEELQKIIAEQEKFFKKK